MRILLGGIVAAALAFSQAPPAPGAAGPVSGWCVPNVMLVEVTPGALLPPLLDEPHAAIATELATRIAADASTPLLRIDLTSPPSASLSDRIARTGQANQG